jgi:cytochrome c2
MRNATLKQTTIAVVAVLVIAAVTLGVLRNILPSIGSGYSDRNYEEHGNTGLRAAAGEALFDENGCGQCHFTDSARQGIGPGLAGLLDREKLPISGWEANRENIRQQLIDPYRNMPSFAGRLTDEQIDDIISYLEGL